MKATELKFTQSDLIKIMITALRFQEIKKASIEKCLHKALAFHQLIEKMKQGNIVFHYLKADGTLRKAYGTLQDLEEKIRGDRRSKNPDLQVYYDLDKQEFRSFKKINLLQVSEWFTPEGCN